MDNPILYVVLNNSLNMSAGKASAQAVHAAMMLQDNFGGSFTSSYKRTVIVLAAKDSEQIKNLYEYLRGAGIFSDYYIDEGRNEVDAYSITAMVVEPIDSEDKEKREIFEGFHLYHGEAERKVTIRDLEWLIKHYNAPKFVKKTLEWLKGKIV